MSFIYLLVFFFFKQKTAYEMRISDWSSDVCSSDLAGFRLDSSVRSRFDYSAQYGPDFQGLPQYPYWAGPGRSLVELPLSTAFAGLLRGGGERLYRTVQRMGPVAGALARTGMRSEEHTSELQSLMRISYAVFCL